MIEGPSSRSKSPPQKIIIKRKEEKRSRDLLVIPESVLIETSSVVLSSTFEIA